MPNVLLRIFKFFKKKQYFIRVLIPIVLIIFTFVCGVCGLNKQNQIGSDAKQNGWNIVHSVLTMFFMNYDGSEDSEICVIIAKYLAAFFTAYILVVLAWKSIASLYVWCRRRFKKSILVIGENIYADTLLEAIKPYGFGNKWKSFPGRGKIILMGSEEENLQYLQEHSLLNEKIKGYESRIFVRTSKMNGKITINGNISFFSLEEIAARKYWLKYPVVNQTDLKSVICSTDEQHYYIAIIGEGELLEEMLLYGTQMNVYGENFHIHYDIYGNNQLLEATHNHCEKLGFHFYHGDWWKKDEAKKRLKKYNRIIILDQDNPYQVFSNILCVAPSAKAIHVFSREALKDANTRTIWQDIVQDDRGMAYQGEFVLFDWIGESCNTDLINDNVIYNAIGCNEVYRAIFPENGGKPWRELDSYTKYSNILSFLFANKYIDLLFKKSSDGKITEEDDDALKKFAMLEHTRWCNYNYYFNWTYGNIEKKDKANRIHPDLKSYPELGKDEQMKDNNCIVWLRIRDEMSGNVKILKNDLEQNEIIQEIIKQKNQ